MKKKFEKQIFAIFFSFILCFVCSITGFVFLHNPSVLYPDKVVNVDALNNITASLQLRCDLTNTMFVEQLWNICNEYDVQYTLQTCNHYYITKVYQELIVNCDPTILKSQFPSVVDLSFNKIAFFGIIMLLLAFMFFLIGFFVCFVDLRIEIK